MFEGPTSKFNKRSRRLLSMLKWWSCVGSRINACKNAFFTLESNA